MKTTINPISVKLWLSARDTYDWANRTAARWPCSQLERKRLFVEFDTNGLCDLAIDGKSQDCDANELNAIVVDHLDGKLPESHPCYFVVIGQFRAARARAKAKDCHD